MNYTQENRFFHSWFLFTFLPVIIITLIYYYNKIGLGMFSSLEFWLVLFIVILPLIFLLSMKLKVIINNEEIRYQYFPVHWKCKTISLSEIKEWYLISFDPLTDFLGYGYRVTKKYGTALITDSNIGLLIKTNRDKIITIEIRDLTKFRKVAKENEFYIEIDKITPIRELFKTYKNGDD